METICPKTKTIHSSTECIWCGRDDLVPAGIVTKHGTNCTYCGQMVYLCQACGVKFAREDRRREAAGWYEEDNN